MSQSNPPCFEDARPALVVNKRTLLCCPFRVPFESHAFESRLRYIKIKTNQCVDQFSDFPCEGQSDSAAMDFPMQLLVLLKADETSGVELDKIEEWCDEIERYLSDPSSQQETNREVIFSEDPRRSIQETSRELHKGIVLSIQPSLSVYDTDTDGGLDKINSTTKLWYLENKDEISIRKFSSYVRASRNLLRWHVQVYMDKYGTGLPSPVRCLKESSMIELLLCVLESEEPNMESGQQERARNISLYLFYATYIAFPGDEESQQSLGHLIFNLSFTKTVLQLLTKPSTAGLMLSLVRTVHSAIVSLQGAANLIMHTKISWKGPSVEAVHWVPKTTGDLSFATLCRGLMRWALDSDPTFPGDKNDRRAELATEILGAFYGLRMGQVLDAGQGDEGMFQILVDILKQEGDSDKRVVQCKTSAVSLLMDADRGLGVELKQSGALESLLQYFDNQVRETVRNERVADSAAAALVPVLVVLNKFATANPELLRTIKLFIFPPEVEEDFQEKVKEHERTTHERNMSPLDAPKGSLRWNLIALMTWPEPHIKRCTGELFWTLCSSNAKEFIHRIGFGNGMPLLGAKGVVQMPEQGSAEPRFEIL
eukprot:scaffold11032_cov122-Cylindrotheca_fusiformis.AAC.19